MARIKTYIKDNIISEKDIIIGSDFESDGATKNYTVKSLIDLILSKIGVSSNIITSVFGRTGVVIANNGDYTKSQVGLSEVDNTSDINKPLSTAASEAISNAISSAYRIKGSVVNYLSLPNSGQVIGDVYNLLDNGMNYVWTGILWDALGMTIDVSSKANIDSPILTGIPTAPTAALGTNTMQLATTAYVTENIAIDKFSQSITSSAESSTTSVTDVTVSGMIVTPTIAGTYKVDFNGQYDVIPGNVCTIASLDLQNMYLNLLNIPATATHGLTFGSGETISPGIYTVAGAMSVAGTLTLDGGGNPNALFVFRVTGAINTAISTTIQLSNSANAANVFFMAVGAVGIGAENVVSGNFIAYGAAAALGANCIFNGRLFSTSGALAFSSGIQSKPTAVSVINMGILENFLCFTNQGNVANTALAVITGDLGTNFGLVTVFATSVFNGNAYDDTQQLGSTNVFSLYSGAQVIENSSRLRRYYNYTEDVVLLATVTITENQPIGVKFRTDVGRVILKNRVLTVVKI